MVRWLAEPRRFPDLREIVLIGHSAGAALALAGAGIRKGDTVAALHQAGVAGDFTFISTAGGAFLEWMEGKDLPGVAALLR